MVSPWSIATHKGFARVLLWLISTIGRRWLGGDLSALAVDAGFAIICWYCRLQLLVPQRCSGRRCPLQLDGTFTVFVHRMGLCSSVESGA